MSIESIPGVGIIVTGEEDTRRVSFLAQKHAMRLELKGIRVKRWSVIARIKKHYGFKGNRQSVYTQFCQKHGLEE